MTGVVVYWMLYRMRLVGAVAGGHGDDEAKTKTIR